MKNIALIANGEIEDDSALIEAILSHDYLIAVDGGTGHCHKFRLVPSLIIGDLDSASPEHLDFYKGVPTQTFPQDKDKTDLELALEHAQKLNPSKITLFGALGGRIDHALSNVNLLSLCPGKLFMETANETLFVVHRHVQFHVRKGQTISLIPLNGPATGITTHGLKWELKNGRLDKYFFGISNVALAETVEISLLDGDLLCCINKHV